MRPVVLIVGTLDTKAGEIAFLRERITAGGCDAIVMDVGVFSQSELDPDIPRDRVAEAAGRSVREILDLKDRKLAVFTMMKGGAVLARQLLEDDRVSGVVSCAGGTGTHIAAGLMRSLPVGVPKLMVSTVASRDVNPIVGDKDITLMNSVVDLFGDNYLTRRVLAQAAGAIVGMVTAPEVHGSGRPVIALTTFGPLNDAAMTSTTMLEDLGYEVVPFHAVGAGGMAMEAIIEQGVIDGVLDLALHELADHLYAGYCGNIDRRRLATAGPKKAPRVVLPGGLDIIAFETVSREGVPEQLRDRKFAPHDFRSFVRTSARDYERLAEDVAERLGRLESPVTFIVPLQGWSKVDMEGNSFYEPHTNEIFIEKVRHLLPPGVKMLETDSNINNVQCVKLAVDELLYLMDGNVDR
ncbi:MAG: Tm-1-like ATP-binding domain-containing protein [Desulfomonilaceae bacterium]|nr:Tm-1-like ATP-binding domain-containing protein [Desulfomonilaceae bacterium]